MFSATNNVLHRCISGILGGVAAAAIFNQYTHHTALISGEEMKPVSIRMIRTP